MASKVVVAVPVHNGAHLLAESLSCLARQSWPDLNVAVFDNASADGTAEIARSFADRHEHFRYVRRPGVVPIVDHFRLCLVESECDYFAWRAHDDLSSDDFVGKLADALDRNPDADLAVGAIDQWKVDSGKREIVRADSPLDGVDFATMRARLFPKRASWIHGLFRREALLRNFDLAMREFGHFWAFDHALLLPTLIKPRGLIYVDDCLFTQRILAVSRATNSPEFSPGAKLRNYFAMWRYCLRQIARSDNDTLLKLRLVTLMPRYVGRRTHRPKRIVAKVVRAALSRPGRSRR